MGVNGDFPNVVSGRISDRSKAMMEKYGFTVRDAIEWYTLYCVNPSKFVDFQKKVLKNEIQLLKMDLIAKEMELESLEKGDDVND